MAQQLQRPEVQAVLSGQRVEQVALGSYVVNIGAVEGGVINFAAPGKKAADRIRPRYAPPRIRPRTVQGFLDRERELGLIGRALARGQIVDLHGPDGMGKTALISQAMRMQLPSAFPDGMVYLSGRQETYQDLLQDLFECFFQSDGHIKVTEDEFRRYLAGKRALIAVDDANRLREGEAERLAHAMPDSGILIAGRQQQVWQGVAVGLRGLPKEQGVALFERHWGHVSTRDRPVVEGICEALDNVPLSIIKTAMTVVQRRVPLVQVLRQVQSPVAGYDPVGQAFNLLAGRLSAEERRVLGALAASSEAKADLEELQHISALPVKEITHHLNGLKQVGLVEKDDSRYSLDDGFVPYVQAHWTDEEMKTQAADLYSQGLDQIPIEPEAQDERKILVAVQKHYRDERWEQVLQLGQNLGDILAQTGQWGRWRITLGMVRGAARKLDNWQAEARALNDLGIIEAYDGKPTQARKFYDLALGIQRKHGDRAGEKTTLQNLELLAFAQPADAALGVQTALGEVPDRMPYNIPAVHELLTSAFTHQDLLRFCREHPFLRPVLKDFGADPSLNEMADELIRYCDKNSLWNELLSAVQEANPRQYDNFKSALRGP